MAREAEIRGFKPQDCWVVLAGFEAARSRYAGRWLRAEADRLPTLAETEALAVRGKTGTIAKVERKKTQEARTYSVKPVWAEVRDGPDV